LPLAAVLDLAPLGARPTEGDASTGVFLAVVVALGLAAVYAYRVWRYPFVPCARCNGGRKFARGRSRAYRRCKSCGGSGEKVRPIRRLLGWINQ
jgi:hypothetical protein